MRYGEDRVGVMVDWIPLMTDWIRRRRAGMIPPSVIPTKSVQRDRGDAGEYRHLFRYLRDRYANRVVLTFSEIEDLLGFSLPASARLQAEWWGGADPVLHPSVQSDSWTLASRTATVNMSAQSVIFERDTALHERLHRDTR
jgi:hypothetical protein